jgi:predicted nuclease of predicted toxin-antitoxin system
MKPLEYGLLADENIAPAVVAGLRARRYDVHTASEEQLIGRPDRAVLERAVSEYRVVMTHDLGFGRTAIQAGMPFVGIIYIRPGHISAAFVLTIVDALRESTLDVHPPFVIVAERRDAAVRVRVRTEPPW